MSGLGAGSTNHVVVTGREDGPVVMLAHGFGCDQNMWRLIPRTGGDCSWATCAARAHAPPR